jgi:hypothetical protein
VTIICLDCINFYPEISSIEDQVVNEDTAIDSISFTTDIETSGCSLDVTFTSSNTSLVPLENISYTCNAGLFDLSITPLTNQSGNATITITIADIAGLTTTESFVLTVNAVNDPPVIGTIPDQTLNENTSIVGIPFTATDVETASCSLGLTYSISNTNLFSTNSISYSCGADMFYFSLTPTTEQYGNAIFSITITDGNSSDSTAFAITVNAVNDPPIIGFIEDQTTNEDIAILSVPLTVTDIETATCSLEITLRSSNTSLISNNSISYTCSAETFYFSLTPNADQYGNASISITITDGSLSDSASFDLTVNAINDAPIVGSIDDQTTDEDIAIYSISLTLTDSETAGCSLAISKSIMDKKTKTILLDLKHKILNEFDLVEMRLFGSMARRDETDHSDIDLFVCIFAKSQNI